MQYKAVQENLDLMVKYNKELKRILSLHESEDIIVPRDKAELVVNRNTQLRM